MNQQQPRKRLDEILIEEGLVSQEQITEALMRQKVSGGKFGSQLLYYRYIDETGLVKALAKQMNCEGVILSQVDISDDVIKLINPKQALARKIIPFAFDQKTGTLKIACENPADHHLAKEIEFIVSGKFVKLYVAAELAIEAALHKYYLGKNISLNEKLSVELPDLIAGDGETVLIDLEETQLQVKSSRTILIVTDEEYSASLYQTILERDNYKATICDSLAKASGLIDDNAFQAVLIKESITGEKQTFFDKLRKVSPRTIVRTFTESSNLILGTAALENLGEMLNRNLVLFTSLLSSRQNLPENHGSLVGQYVERLCRRMGLPVKDRLTITNAAYMHDLARFYYHSLEGKDYSTIIELSARLLQSLDYPEVIVGMLNSMYKNPETGKSKSLPLEILGGNIITIVDLFYENVELNQKMTLDKFDAIKKKLRGLSNTLFLNEVVEAFIGMMQEEILNLQTLPQIGQILIFTNDPESSYPLELRLQNEGFRIVSETNELSLTTMYGRSRPDILVLALKGSAEEVIALVEKLAGEGIVYAETPTFLLAPKESAAELATAYEKGIEDVIVINGHFDLLAVKIRKIQTQLQKKIGEARGENTKTPGAKGRLADMNLIDLMQALAPGRKTVKLSINLNDSPDNQLVIFLNKGNIVYGMYQDKTGAEAIYEGMTWTDGQWVVEPVGEDALPEPNNQLSNDAILMEGAYRLDEKVRAGQL